MDLSGGIRAYFKESLQLQRMEKFQTSKHFKISCPNILKTFFYSFTQKFLDISISSTTNSDGVFLVISSISYVSVLPNAAGTTAQPTFSIIHSQNFTLFAILFYAFPLFQFKIYNYNCTIPILQLQTTFYNCTNCHQLHVKICPEE